MEESKKKTMWGILSVVALFLLGKMKWVFALLKIAKVKTLISMVIYLATYAVFYGWKFAVALVYLLFVHESGHLYAAKKLKMPTSPAIFIPFVGAVIGMKERPKSAKDEAFLAYMGPLFGLLAFLPAIPLYWWTKEPFWAFVIVLGSIINLFNLIPMTPLDGGRIAAGISTKLWVLGLVLLLVYAVWAGSILCFFVLIMGIIQWREIRKEQKNIDNDRNRVKDYQEMLASLKRIAETSTFDHLQYFAQSLEKDLKAEEKLLETLQLLDEKDEAELTEEQREEKREQKKQQFLSAFEKEVERIHNFVEEKATYYQTSGKDRLKFFFIYLVLVLALGISSYFSYPLLPPLE